MSKWSLIKRQIGRDVPVTKTDVIPPYNLGSGVSSSLTILYGDSVWRTKGGNYIKVSSNYTAVHMDGTIECTTGTFDVTLYSAIGLSGATIIISNTGTGIITLLGYGSETIQEDVSQLLYEDESMTLISDGSNWIVV